VAIQQKLI